MLCLFFLEKAPLVITHFIHPWNMDSFLSLQPQRLKTTFFKREVTLKVSEIMVNCYYILLTTFSFSFKTKFINVIVIIITFIVFLIIINNALF